MYAHVNAYILYLVAPNYCPSFLLVIIHNKGSKERKTYQVKFCSTFQFCSFVSKIIREIPEQILIYLFQGPPGLQGVQGPAGEQGLMVCHLFFKSSTSLLFCMSKFFSHGTFLLVWVTLFCKLITFFFHCRACQVQED